MEGNSTLAPISSLNFYHRLIKVANLVEHLGQLLRAVVRATTVNPHDCCKVSERQTKYPSRFEL